LLNDYLCGQQVFHFRVEDDMDALEVFFSLNGLVSLAMLASLEIVLGIDNLVFMNIISQVLPETQQKLARRLGMAFALVTRILLLLSISWVMKLTDVVISIHYELDSFMKVNLNYDLSWKDLILVGGGIFLIVKATKEILHKMYPFEDEAINKKSPAFWGVVFQIGLMDIIFSLDSVITAVGMVQEISIMIVAVLLSMAVMVMAAEKVAKFVHEHQDLQILGLVILVVIGFNLVAEGMGYHVPKAFIYVTIFMLVVMDLLQMRAKKIRERSMK